MLILIVSASDLNSSCCWQVLTRVLKHGSPDKTSLVLSTDVSASDVQIRLVAVAPKC